MIKDEEKEANTQGIGLGLVISKLVVNKFNGEIDFISKYQKGSTFNVRGTSLRKGFHICLEHGYFSPERELQDAPEVRNCGCH